MSSEKFPNWEFIKMPYDVLEKQQFSYSYLKDSTGLARAALIAW